MYTYIALFIFFISGFVYVSSSKKEISWNIFITYAITFLIIQLIFKILGKYIDI